MPGNRLALAIRVRCQVDVISTFHRPGDGGHLFLAAFVEFPYRGKDSLAIHDLLDHPATTGSDQIPHVTVRGQRLEIRSEVFLHRPGLGRGLDDNQIIGQYCGLDIAAKDVFARQAKHATERLSQGALSRADEHTPRHNCAPHPPTPSVSAWRKPR